MACPPKHVAAMKAIEGVSDENVQQAHALADAAEKAGLSINWQALLDALIKYGPTVLSAVLKIFGIPWPASPTTT